MTEHHSEAEKALERILPELRLHFPQASARPWQAFEKRLEAHFGEIYQLLADLYGQRRDFFYHLLKICESAAASTLSRPAPLRRRDKEREKDPAWFQSETMIGGMCYVDLYGGNLQGLAEKIPYFQELGITYLHLMPLFRCPEEESDGGYAVSSYREVHPSLGTTAQLKKLIGQFHEAGISLVLDFVFNHTSDEHPWALKAIEGDPDYRDHYFIFPDRTLPDRYDRTLRDIFPEVRRGSFTYREDMDSWVWTTFNSFQWDLNYQNPDTFRHMAEEMLFLANLGVDILRLDALAFVWKEMGTPCENLPRAHTLIRAFNLMARLAAPALAFKSEAIVHPDEVAKYIAPHESQISYHPTLMALLWESLATRKVTLLRHSMQKRFALPEGCAWVNYVRSHDDIGWTFADEDAAELWINGYDHRQFLNRFYTGRFPGSFARGVPFQLNPETGDCRISGTCASLAGLEKGLTRDGADMGTKPGAGPQDEREIDMAVRRVLLLHSVILSVGGIPLIYLGDEAGMLNDYSYTETPGKAEDSRWVHRPPLSAIPYQEAGQPETPAGRIYHGLLRMIDLRKTHPALGGQEAEFINPGSEHVLAYVRRHQAGRILVLANFSEQPQTLSYNIVRVHGAGYRFRELISGGDFPQKDFTLGPYQILWLEHQP